MNEPPKEQDIEKDDCPICGLPLKYPALSRFDNETYVCGKCGEAEGTGFLFAFSLKGNKMKMLQDRRWQDLYGLTDWEAHTIVICAIRGARAGWEKKQFEAFQQLQQKMEEE